MIHWWPNWYVTRLHAVRPGEEEHRIYAQPQALCGTWARHPDRLRREPSKAAELDRGLPRCKHCEKILAKKGGADGRTGEGEAGE